MNAPNPAVNQAPSELRAAVAALRPYFVRVGWFSLLSSLLVLAPSGYMLEVYGRVVNSRSHTTLAMLTLLILGVYVVMELLEWARSEVMRAASVELDERMRSRIFHAIFDANLRRIPGGTQQPLNDFRQIREFLYSPVLLGLMESPVSVVMLVLLFLINPVLGWTSIAFACVITLVAWLNERATKPPLMQANRSAIAAQQYADGSLRNAQVIESMGMLRDIHARWMAKQREFLNLQARASEAAGGYQAVSKFLQTTLSSGLLGLGCWLLLHGALNGGDVMMIMASVFGGRVVAPLVQAVSQWQSVVNARDAWARLDQLLRAVPERGEGMPLPAPRGVLQVEPLMAGAPGGTAQILRGVTFALNPGEVLAVVGPSASGKTTLARLLMGLWPSMVGKVRLDGADVFTWDKSELGAHVGYLPQGVELFDGTVAENIARFGEVDPSKVEAAARAVGLHEFIMALPQGYDSPVGRDGAMLSGGQRQRVGLARAIYGDPVFVVLDEPNSSLDEEGDAALANAIRLMKSRGTTFVVMTHRTSVLAVADKMLVLRDGQTQAFGPRDEVLAALQKAAQQQAQQQVAQQALGTA
ncbi:MAG: peptidase [Burkholderiales bacterium 68-12]|nr:MAG: peptidase [Burkholderiales bacterium 68-12]